MLTYHSPQIKIQECVGDNKTADSNKDTSRDRPAIYTSTSTRIAACDSRWRCSRHLWRHTQRHRPITSEAPQTKAISDCPLCHQEQRQSMGRSMKDPLEGFYTSLHRETQSNVLAQEFCRTMKCLKLGTENVN